MIQRLSLAVAIASIVLSGCNLEDQADKLGKAIGLPVELMMKEDPCMSSQLSRLENDFKSLSETEREQIRQTARDKYKGIVLQESESVGSVAGIWLEVKLIRYECNSPLSCDFPREVVVATKVPENSRRLGPGSRMPFTRVTRGEKLSIQIEGLVNLQSRYMVKTASSTVYGHINSYADLQETLRRDARQVQVEQRTGSDAECAPTVGLGELL